MNTTEVLDRVAEVPLRAGTWLQERARAHPSMTACRGQYSLVIEEEEELPMDGGGGL